MLLTNDSLEDALEGMTGRTLLDAMLAVCCFAREPSSSDKGEGHNSGSAIETTERVLSVSWVIIPPRW